MREPLGYPRVPCVLLWSGTNATGKPHGVSRGLGPGGPGAMLPMYTRELLGTAGCCGGLVVYGPAL